MDKKGTLLSKTLVIGVFILFFGVSLVTSNCIAFNKINNIGIKNNSFKSNRIKMSKPPVAEILYPDNGSTIYTRYTNFSVKFIDDTGVTNVNVEYGGSGYTVGIGSSVHPPNKIYYLNRSMEKVQPGYVWIVAKAFDEDGNIGIDTAIFYYDDSNDTDLNSPGIDILHPNKGYIYIFERKFPEYPGIKKLNYSIVLGKFELLFVVNDIERHLQKVEIFIDNELVYEQEYTDIFFDLIRWNCNKFLIGMHEIKIVATDSYDNSAIEKLNCFIINFF